LLLNTREMLQAARRSRADVKALLEKELKRLQRYDFPRRAIVHSGNNMGSES
jgi:hypothetical protein